MATIKVETIHGPYSLKGRLKAELATAAALFSKSFECNSFRGLCDSTKPDIIKKMWTMGRPENTMRKNGSCSHELAWPSGLRPIVAKEDDKGRNATKAIEVRRRMKPIGRLVVGINEIGDK
ncbi:hypothetical protein PspLS_01423 [Pyricularia sp. CBS 133598]|nr:hypothetical protein PspLS_01423 [Pyricularia sp. CBS 133598]